MVLYEKILRALQREKVKFLVVGGLAVNFHGYNRLTGDMDIIVLMEAANIRRLLKVAKAFKLKPRIPEAIDKFAIDSIRDTWIKNKNMKAFALFHPNNSAEHLDIVIDHPLNFRKAYKNKMLIREGTLTIPVVSIPDLLMMKKFAGRERDKQDIRALKQIQELDDD